MPDKYIVEKNDLTSIANAIRALNNTSDQLVFPDGFVSAIQADGLNFKVVGGTTKPGNPKENTIWVNTNVEITEYAFSTKNPFADDTELIVQANHTINSSSTNIVIIDNSNGSIIASQTITGTTSYSEFTNATVSFETLSGLQGTLTCSVKKTSPFFTGTVAVDKVAAGTVEFGTGTNSSYTWSDEQSVIIKGSGTPKLGQVWISTGAESSVAFSVTKNNPIMIYPILVMQYKNNTWSNVEAMIYQNGSWKDFKIWLFKSGQGALTTFVNWKESTDNTLNIRNDYIYIAYGSSSNGSVQVVESAPRNITGYSKMMVDMIPGTVRANYARTFGLASHPLHNSYTAPTWVASKALSSSPNREVYELDISDLNGEYYVWIWGISTNTYIYNIWFE